MIFVHSFFIVWWEMKAQKQGRSTRRAQLPPQRPRPRPDMYLSLLLSLFRAALVLGLLSCSLSVSVLFAVHVLSFQEADRWLVLLNATLVLKAVLQFLITAFIRHLVIVLCWSG